MNIGDLQIYQSKYLKADDLQGRSVRVTIRSVTAEKMRNPRTQEDEQKAVVWFEGKQKGLVINKTRLSQLVSVFGTDDSNVMTGKQIMLAPAEMRGKQTIVVSAVPQES